MRRPAVLDGCFSRLRRQFLISFAFQANANSSNCLLFKLPVIAEYEYILCLNFLIWLYCIAGHIQIVASSSVTIYLCQKHLHILYSHFSFTEIDSAYTCIGHRTHPIYIAVHRLLSLGVLSSQKKSKNSEKKSEVVGSVKPQIGFFFWEF